MATLTSAEIAAQIHDALEMYDSANSQAELARLLNRSGIHYGRGGYITVSDIKRGLNWEKNHQGQLPSDPPPNVKHRPYCITYYDSAYRLVVYKDPVQWVKVTEEVYGGGDTVLGTAAALIAREATILEEHGKYAPTPRQERESKRNARNLRRVVEDLEDIREDIKEGLAA